MYILINVIYINIEHYGFHDNITSENDYSLKTLILWFVFVSDFLFFTMDRTRVFPPQGLKKIHLGYWGWGWGKFYNVCCPKMKTAATFGSTLSRTIDAQLRCKA